MTVHQKLLYKSPNDHYHQRTIKIKVTVNGFLFRTKHLYLYWNHLLFQFTRKILWGVYNWRI